MIIREGRPMGNINDFVMKNLIYCEDTHSLVHRLYMKWKGKFPDTKLQAQEDAWDIIKEMNDAEVQNGSKEKRT